MTNLRNKAIPSSTYLPVRIIIYPTIPWQVKIWSVLFQYAPHGLHDDVSLSSPLKGIVLLPNITRSLFTIRSGNTDIGNDSAEATVFMVPLKWGWNLQNGDSRDTHCTNGIDRG